MSAIISVSQVSKQYRLGEVGTGSLQQDINRWWHRLRGKEDPYLQVGDSNDRSSRGQSDYVWALQDINFEVQRGEVLGIIGRNGAGKSTLLKILSRVAEPTTGRIAMQGRIASLLEVGTGMHPDLTGRENVYLNGAILGMSKKEISSRFDEIVAFAGVERYIDTPVKRYSSGMHVRLGFAVAAHLEPDVLIVDEVLAVGDYEFQKKCLGKMREVSQAEGRTILFVSHNMTAIRNLCSRAIILNNGMLVADGLTEQVIKDYGAAAMQTNMRLLAANPQEAPGNDKVRVKRLEVLADGDAPSGITVHTPIRIEFEFWNQETSVPVNLSFHLYTANQECVFNAGSDAKILAAGLHRGVCIIPGGLLNDNVYTVSMMVVGDRSFSLYHIEHAISFEVFEDRPESGWHGKWPGIIRPSLPFSLEAVSTHD
jgi:lipopolysaccharide transport system ATP-binding protein